MPPGLPLKSVLTLLTEDSVDAIAVAAHFVPCYLGPRQIIGLRRRTQPLRSAQQAFGRSLIEF